MSLAKEAEAYIDMGFAVFPVRRNKRPYTTHGCLDASRDKIVVGEWWKRWPDANIGIATGSKSGGIIVIDVDIDEDKGIYGDDTLREWEKENGQLPDTWMAVTGRGGNHYYYKSKRKIKNSTGIYPGIDIRGEGGYVIAPPSVHQNGTQYQWENDPEEYELKEVDEQVLKFLNKTGEEIKREKFVLPEVIANGTRNNTLYKYGCSLQSQGVSDEEILLALQDANTRCTEPLKDEEIKTLYESATSKPKGIKRIYSDSSIPEKWREPEIAKTDDGKVCQTIDNAVEAIKYDKFLYGKIRLNTLAYSPYVFGDLPWNRSDKIREWTNVDDSNLKRYIEKIYGIRPTEKLMDALLIVADDNRYNPVIDALEQRWHQWDGQEHIKNLLPDYLGAERTKYTEEVMKLFMLGAIARAYTPGCKFDYVPIIYGEQGCGKSTFCRALAMDEEWYDDNFNTIEGDKASEKLRGLWMAELAELLATKKAKELESIKSFITSRADNYRPPYARRTEHRSRACVFIGTTNSDHFLTDRTGNRRFLPIIADKAAAKYSITTSENFARAVIDVNNAWGEAMDIYQKAKGRPPLVMPLELAADVEAMQARFREDDPTVGLIEGYLERCVEKKVCALEIWEKALGNVGKPSRYESNLIHTILTQDIAGWVRLDKKQRCGEYGVQFCYVPELEKSIEDGDLPFK